MTKELFLNDSYQTTCNANILSIEGDKVVLDQTIFYPTGGGQECDTGTLIQEGKPFDVVQVKREGRKIFHFVKNAQQLKLGAATANIDWERRRGLMRHHSLLHVLGAVVYKKYGALCTGNKIYPHKARIDFNHLQDLKDDQYDDIVKETNQIIKESHPINYQLIPRSEAESRTGLVKTAVNLLPPTVTEIRLVRIESIDEQACGGTHVSNTKEIGEMKLVKVSSKGKNNKRLEVKLISSEDYSV
ncbi:MAG TPA: alanyl-tRNA editing protein [Bacillus bacterium]|uniref:Alanyl-tRNA editing protein n=1 Tax=Siminovitchia fordii TaxID=254759 RepID=A0ABQ4K2N8_9BACI|nr:alanyl-tRNA editing protein [Siminovitchia fordii]GIN19397.1 alanyl-tRNA editing protein [Siminovitchia fordii]HBZ10010.1 alanyl-tRNA editing protein [Bacillus sp. (in: firmicutes)]